MRGSRLLSILILLQLRERMTADDLAEEFEVSVRTIYRDIDHLSAAGVPVYGDRGPGGGFSLLDGYATRLTGLDSDEAEAIFLAGMPDQARQLGLGAAASRARLKLLAALPREVTGRASRVRERFHIDPAEWYHEAETSPNLSVVARAVLDQDPIEMTYESWSGTREWRVEPFGLVLKGSAWYLVGRVRSKISTFRVSNIHSLSVTPGHFERPADFDLARHWAESLIRFEEALRSDVALIHVSPVGRDRLVRLGAFAARAVASARPIEKSDWIEVPLPIETIGQAALALFGLGPEVKVIQPPALRGEMKRLALRMLEFTAS